MSKLLISGLVLVSCAMTHANVFNFDLNNTNSIVLDGNDWKLYVLGCVDNAGPVSENELAAIHNDFNDSSWKTVQVPRAGENDVLNIEQARSAQKTVIGWYRKQFSIPANFKNQRIFLKFSGVSHSCDIWINGKHAARHEGMYDAFDVEITDLVNAAQNQLTLRFDYPLGSQVFKFLGSQDVGHSQPGIGVWASVYMVSTPKEFVRTCLIIPDLERKVIRAAIELDGNVTSGSKLCVSIVDPCTDTNVGSSGSVELTPGLKETNVVLSSNGLKEWHYNHPKLYKLVFSPDNNSHARQTFTFGYRSFITRDKHFVLNHEPVYLKAMLLWSGTVSYGRSDFKAKADSESYIRLFKSKNLNIVRTAHSSPSEQLLSAADELGFMIFIDFGNQVTDPNLLPAVAQEIRRLSVQFYNHPSLVMYSLGNEVWQTMFIDPQNALFNAVRNIDKTRPITPVSGGHSFPGMPEKPYRQIDFYDIHNYSGHMDRPWNYLQESLLQTNIGIIAKLYGKCDKPLWVGESVGTSWPLAPQKARSDEPITPQRYVDLCESGLAPTWATEIGTWKYFWPVSKTGGPGESNKWITGRIVKLCAEQMREIPQYVQGFCLWADSFDPDSERVAFTNVLASNWKIKRHYFSGSKIDDPLIISNTLSRSFNGKILSRLTNADNKVLSENTIELASVLPISSMQVSNTLDLNDNLNTGFYNISFIVQDANCSKVSENSYKIFIADKSKIESELKKAGKLYIIYDNNGSLGRLISKYGIAFEHTKGKLPQEGAAAVLNLAGEAIPKDLLDANELGKWLSRGGRLLVNRLAVGERVPAVAGFKCVQARPMANIEIVSPKHAIWDGLEEDNFFFWNMPMGNLVSNAIFPLTRNVLAGKGFDQSNSMAVSEFKIGSGGVLVNQTFAFEAAANDSSAVLFCANMLKYITSSNAFIDAEQPIGAFELDDFKVDMTKVVFLNIRQAANVPFTDEKGDDKKGGWPDQGSLNLGSMKPGVQVLGGVPFKILDEKQGNTAIALYGYERPYYPMESGKIEVGKKLKELYFLHTAAWCNREYVGGREIATYDIIYEDGLLVQIPVIGFKNIAEWWNAADLKNAVVGWSGLHPNSKEMTIGMYVMKWENPRPDKQIISFNLRAQKTSASVVIAGVSGIAVQ